MILAANQSGVSAVRQEAGPFVRAIFEHGSVEAAYNYMQETYGEAYNASLPRGTWEMVSDIIYEETQQSLIAVNDLRARPQLVQNVPIYTLVYTSHLQSDLPAARQAMNTMVTPQHTDLSYSTIGVPLPMIYMDTQLGMREAAMPRPQGGLSSAWAAVSTQKINEAMENNLFNGNAAIGAVDEQQNLRTLLGYTTHPQRNIVVTAGVWTDFAAVTTDFEAMKSRLRNDFFRPPYMVYVSDSVWALLQRRNLSGSERTHRELLLDSPELTDIKHTFDLAAGEMLMVALVPQTVTFIESAQVQLSDWEAMGMFGTQLRMFGISAAEVKATNAGRSGIAHMTGIS